MEKFLEHLRDDCRLKEHTDFAYTCKYGEVHILCYAAFEEEIRDVADRFCITVHSIHTY